MSPKVIIIIGIVIICMVASVSGAVSISDCRADVQSVGDVFGARPDGTMTIPIHMGETVQIISINQIDQIERTNITCSRPGSIISVVIIGRVQSQEQMNTRVVVPQPTETPTIVPTVVPKTTISPIVAETVATADVVEKPKTDQNNGNDKPVGNFKDKPERRSK